MWFGSVGKIFTIDSKDWAVRVSWAIKEASFKNVNCLLYIPLVDEVWSCGDTETLHVWRGNIWGGTRRIAQLDGHEVGSRVLALEMSPDQTLLFSGGTDSVVLLWNIKARQVIQRIVPGHSTEISTLSVLYDQIQFANGRQIRSATLLCSTKEGVTHQLLAKV